MGAVYVWYVVCGGLFCACCMFMQVCVCWGGGRSSTHNENMSIAGQTKMSPDLLCMR